MNIYKLLYSGIAIAFTTSTICMAQAQIPPSLPTPTPPSQPTSPTFTPLKATDLPLLTRAIGKFWQTERAEIESKMELDLSDEKGKSKTFVSIKSIAKVGRKFRAELTINRVGNAASIKYTVVSDGSKIWIYRPDFRQYAQISTGEFNSNPAFILGLFTLITISPSESQRQDLITDILGENNKIVVPPEKFRELLVGQQKIDGRNLFVYKYGDSDPTNISGFVNPQTAMVERIEFKFEDISDRRKHMEIVETIIKRNPQIAITDKTFTFSPKGVKKVKSLQIEPFNSIKFGIN
jgi:outer membrane lipoprotein-sorting protein